MSGSCCCPEEEGLRFEVFASRKQGDHGELSSLTPPVRRLLTTPAVLVPCSEHGANEAAGDGQDAS